MHLIDWHCGTLKQVSRSTFTSEGLACVAAVDQGITVAVTLHEVIAGPTSIAQTKKLVEEAQLTFGLEAYVDAMSLLKALQASAIKIPQERSFLLSQLWLSQYLQKGVLRSLSWTDTRDMIADGLTKGSIDRILLHKACEGSRTLTHATEKLSKDSMQQGHQPDSAPDEYNAHWHCTDNSSVIRSSFRARRQ